ncbi:hypothetical protein L3556_13075 [Candidatus Synechococcus calcipolaris G9]|uniref:Uncharacterized protein n=1 Tax=Candidatus Synechococcus calcipolaris G9 TaxID=1497997 RepID=A0ABT6F1W5_9SYNE|nr:hypothetical protein [Candidatus Synechococcus calcipolaris]MDG2991854.1 hypothetical protein [Candidatus Synechococcus calcipolaris G9]
MSEQEFQVKVLSEFEALRMDIGKVNQRLDRVEADVKEQGIRFEAYQKGSEAMVRMATTIIIASASVVVLSSLSPAITALVTAIAHQGG